METEAQRLKREEEEKALAEKKNKEIIKGNSFVIQILVPKSLIHVELMK